MSRSPLKAVAQDEASDYRESFVALRHMMRQGSGWSGGERNCVFLNTGAQSPDGAIRFANVSATSGFDFKDDGRGLGVVDWDFDGDLDFWTSSRTSPRLRFLRNETNTSYDFLALRLQGTTSNRDAIGSRVEVRLRDASKPIIKTLHAGDGFLSQASKWLHFGLGANAKIERVIVTWPSGETKELKEVVANQFYHLTEGQDGLEIWTPPSRRIALRPQTQSKPAKNDKARVFLASRVPAPDIHFTDFAGQPQDMNALPAGPKLVNLWASWCTPCMKELKDFTSHSQAIRQSGLEIVALSLDGVGKSAANSPQKARELLQRLNFPFTSGLGDADLLNMVELMHGALLYPLRSFPIPTSLLIDKDGWIAAIYQGTVEIETLLEDVAKLETPSNSLRDLAVPFSGRWLAEPKFFDYLNVMGLDYIDGGYPQLAETHYRKLLHTKPQQPQWLNNLGIALNAQDKFAEAEAPLAQALKLEPQHVEIYNHLAMAFSMQGKSQNTIDLIRHAQENNATDAQLDNQLAWALATTTTSQSVSHKEAIALAEKVCAQTRRREPRYLDTLAAAYARAGRFDEAITTINEALSLAQRQQESALQQELTLRLQLYKNHRPYVVKDL